MPYTKSNNINAISSIKTKPDQITDIAKKRCSIVLFTNRNNLNVYNYLHSLSTSRVSGQYEVLIINNGPTLIDESYLNTYMDNVKIIRPPLGLKFIQLCLLAAQQATGKYIIFSQQQLNENRLNKLMTQLETSKAKMAIPEEKNYILVNRTDFLNTGSFEGLTAKQESEQQRKEQQTYHHILLAELNRYEDVRGKSVLVVGCNRGLECDLLIRMGAKEATGLDVSEHIGEEYQHPRIRYVRSSAEMMPFEDNSFDVCFSIATLEHIPNPKVALNEMVRVTSKRGIIYCQAAPLWNSAFGHHMKNKYPDEPWIHLRKKNAIGMKSYYRDKTKSCSFDSNIDYIFSKAFNRTSTKEYKSIVADILHATSPIHIGFNLNYTHSELLKPYILAELQDYSEDELLTDGLRLVLRKV